MIPRLPSLIILLLGLAGAAAAGAFSQETEQGLLGALEDFDKERFYRFMVRADLERSEEERILSDDELRESGIDLSSGSEGAGRGEEAKPGASSRERGRDEFQKKLEKVGADDPGSAAASPRGRSLETIDEVEAGRRDDLKPHVERLGRRMLAEFPWESSLIMKASGIPVTKAVRLFRRDAELNPFAEACLTESYGGFWGVANKSTTVFAGLLFLGIVVYFITRAYSRG